MIKSLLDTDYYKLLMQQLFFHRFPEATGEYVFKLRNKDISLIEFKDEITTELKALCQLNFTQDEIDYLKTVNIKGYQIFKDDYLDMLSDFQLNFNDLTISEIDGHLSIRAKGTLYSVMMFEIYTLSIVNETYFSHQYESKESAFYVGMDRLQHKLNKLNALDSAYPDYPLKIADFGTRRRFSFEWQGKVIKMFKEQSPDILMGTSNVFYAKQFGLTPIGTMAHEYLQAMQALNTQGLLYSQKEALEIWLDEYDGHLANALTDVIGMEAFLKDFNYELSNAYSGTRHDSGNSYWWADLQLRHYTKLGIDAKKKTLVFSDGLYLTAISELFKCYAKYINLVFGWGTNLTNDLGFNALNIVMKIVNCNGKPVVKLSDSEGKTMCEDETYVKKVKKLFNK
jgi:nicotinate phosphoribosyltransferase